MTTHTHLHDHRIPAHVRPAVRDRIGEHRARETRLITTALAAVCALGFASAVIPGVEHAASLVVTAALALAGLALLARLGARWVRERREDRADAVTAARWRAEHAPHLLDERDRAHLTRTRPAAATGPAGVA